MSSAVLVPPLGQTVDTLTLVSWYRHEGDAVTQGEPLFVVETDKATLDVEAPASGVLSGVCAAAGDQVKVLAAIATIEEFTPPAAPPGQPDTIESKSSEPQRLFVSPRARRLAESGGVPLDEVKATGPMGAIVERDVLAYLAESQPQGTAAEDVTPAATPSVTPAAEPGASQIIPLAGVRGLIAERMAASHRETAAVTLTTEADATALVSLRTQLAEDGVAVSYSDLFLTTLARALAEHPRLNASLIDDRVRIWPQIDLGLAVDAERGLIVPVVRDVDRKGLAQLAAETVELAERARSGRCTPEELTGSTFTLTNLGMYGIDAFTPIINLPECAILGVGRIVTQPAWVVDHVEPRERVWLSLTFDHRLVDGGPAARFLQRIAQLVEKPHLLMA